MSAETKTTVVLMALAVAFVALAAAFAMNLAGHPVSLKPIPLVDTNFLSTATFRRPIRTSSAPARPVGLRLLRLP